MAHTVILALHIAVGSAGVLLGPVALVRIARGRADWVSAAFHLSVGLVCVSAVGLAALDVGRLWWFVLVAAGSYAFALRARLAIRSARPGWPARALRGFGGSYIALWTAIAVVSVPGQPIFWALPAVVGAIALELVVGRLQRRTDVPRGLPVG